MFKQLTAGIVSFGLLSTMTAPIMAQSVNSKVTSTETKSVPSNNLLVEDYSNSYKNVPQAGNELNNQLNTLAVKNTVNFSDINVDENVIALEDLDLLSQRRTSSGSKYKYSAGLDFINFGWVKDDNGAITSVLGFNLGLGIGYRQYFKPTRDNKFNFNFTLATYFLIVPLAAVG